MKTRIVLIVTFLLAIPNLVNAQKQADKWIGKSVITKPGTVLQVGDEVVDDEGLGASLKASGKERRRFRAYQVERADGQWLWLKERNSGIAGWVPIDNVVLLEDATGFFTNLIQANPAAELFNVRAWVWLELGEIGKAIADFNEAIRLSPDEALYYCNRGVAWAQNKDQEGAMADFDQALRLDPKLALAYYNRGDVWSNKNEYDKAIADYNEAIRLNPKDAAAFINRGNSWDRKKEYDRAIADYDRAIHIAPEFAWAYNNRGNSWAKKNEHAKAIADYDEVLRLEPGHLDAASNRAFSWQKLKNYEKAIAGYKEVIKLNPKDTLTYNSLAWLLATCPDARYRDGNRAIEVALKACELSEWKDAYAQDTLAAAYAETGDFVKAIEWQEKALKLCPVEDKKDLQMRLELFRARKPYRNEG